MKKTCKNCRALNNECKCDLGYKVKTRYYDDVIAISAIPLEKCPKPKTYKNYINLMKNKTA